ncbi:uncharacterized protein LOC103317287 [Nasonia vitripennis]|uniref:Uncharacterized protein n=1 Tax=Nasonia vitripennis TaxID=7425 RepID=A0A7M7T9A9_NASVI|nr:uncharacterized protein LOC103317287 [Nasonia vitripennis]
MNRYKKYFEVGDEGITKRTAQRYKNVLNQTDTFDEICSSQTSLVQAEENNSTDELCEGSSNENMTFSAYESQDHDLSSYLGSIMLDGVKENQDQSFKCPKSLAEMMNNVDFMDSIKVSVNIKKGELFLMILKFCITNSLSVTAMTNLFKLINIIFDSPILPDSRYSLDKLLNPKEHAEFHAVCHNCTAYVGKFGEISSVKNCKICEAELDLDNPSSTSFFVLLDPSTQIQNLLNLYEDHYEYVVNERISKPDRIEDVYDGKEYRKFVKTLPPEEKVLTIFYLAFVSDVK